MSNWGYVSIGWISTYITIACWFYYSKPKKIEK